MSALRAPQLPEETIRARARTGPEAAFPVVEGYGLTLFGAPGRAAPPLESAASDWSGGSAAAEAFDPLDAARIVPPVFVPRRLERLIDLGREPLYSDVELGSRLGGFASALPLFVCAFGSTQVAAGGGLGTAVSTQAGRLGIPMVIGENIVPMHGYGRAGEDPAKGLLGRIRAYADAAPDGLGGVVVQQSTEDADAEVWNLVYSDPSATELLESGRLAFELKVGQGAKPGLGGMTLLSRTAASSVADHYALDEAFGPESDLVLRSSSPGTFTEEILRQQVHLMRNNYPRARTWVKLHPGRDVHRAAEIAWSAGADAVTVDGAEGGTGWAPSVFLGEVGLPLAECLRRLRRAERDAGGEPGAGDGGGPPEARSLLVSGRIWEGGRALKCLALGAAAAGLGRAALLAVDEDPRDGLIRLVRCLEFELRLLISALGKYRVADLGVEDVWFPSAAMRGREGQG